HEKRLRQILVSDEGLLPARLGLAESATKIPPVDLTTALLSEFTYQGVSGGAHIGVRTIVDRKHIVGARNALRLEPCVLERPVNGLTERNASERLIKSEGTGLSERAIDACPPLLSELVLESAVDEAEHLLGQVHERLIVGVRLVQLDHGELRSEERRVGKGVRWERSR